MTTNPIYDQLVAEQKFDPATVPPSLTRGQRRVAHMIWMQKVETMLTKPVRKPAKRAAS